MWNGALPVRVCCPATPQEIARATSAKLKKQLAAAKAAQAAAMGKSTPPAHGPTRRRPIPRAYGAGQGPGHESGLWPALIWLGKAIGYAGVWIAAEWGIEELLETEAEVDASAGKKGSPQANATGIDDPLSVHPSAQKQALTQAPGFKARGEALLSGPYRAIYLNMLNSWKAKIIEGKLTGREEAGLRTLLYKYTLKHGNCEAKDAGGALFLNPSEVAACEKYKKAHPPGAPGASPSEIAAASAGGAAPKWLPLVLIGGAALLLFFMTKDKR
tara:strand:- start:196 stop:1011 length:816 start_codon:yes stop_codon:yes gene_type:complete